MKILLTGTNGQLGHVLQSVLATFGDVVAVSRGECDLAFPEKIVSLVEHVKPSLIINAAAYTAVDKAESEPELAFAINATAPKTLAAQANLRGIPLIHYSTDYVFDGASTRPYEEDDLVNPLSVYGLSKWQGEQNVRAMCEQNLIIRTEWVYGTHGNNFLKKILQLAQERDELEVVAEQFGAPTSTRFLAQATAQAVKRILHNETNGLFGTYHVAARGYTNWHNYAVIIVSLANKLGLATKLAPKDIHPIALTAYQLAASRPKNCRLNTQKAERLLGITAPDWEVDVEHTLQLLISGRLHEK